MVPQLEMMEPYFMELNQIMVMIKTMLILALQGNLNSNASYRSAMSFNAILACPMPATLYVGKYEVTGDMSTGTFGATFSLPCDTRRNFCLSKNFRN